MIKTIIYITTVYENNCNEILSLLEKESDDESLLMKAELSDKAAYQLEFVM